MILVISLIIISLAGLAEAVMDVIQFHFSDSIFSNSINYKNNYWNPQDSWKNKWKDYDPQLGEKFKGSSTLFVFTTDAWHFFKFIRTSLLFIGLGIIAWQVESFINLILLIALARTIFGIAFTLGFDKIFKK
jgi:hypothetical protein